MQIRKLIAFKTMFRFKTSACAIADFKPILTQSGRCYTFNADLNKEMYQVAGGSGNGLSLYLDVLQSNYTEEPESGRIEAGIKLQVIPHFELMPLIHPEMLNKKMFKHCKIMIFWVACITFDAFKSS